MKANYAYPGRFLFAKGHCVVHAWAHAAGLDADGAKMLAEYAYNTPSIVRPRRGVRNAVTSPHLGCAVEPLLDRTTGAAWVRPDPCAWAALAGVRIVHEVHPAGRNVTRRHPWNASLTVTRFYAVTVEAFRKANPVGRFVVLVRGHALALIDGVLYGDWAPRSRVDVAYQVEVL